MIHLLRATLLLGLAGLIGKLFLAGQMAFYLSPAFDPLTGLTAVVLAGLGGVELRAALAGPRPKRTVGSLVDQSLSFALVLVAVVLGLFVTPRGLSSLALGGQDVSRLTIAYAPGPPPTTSTPPARPIQDWPDLFAYLRQVGEGGVGQRVHAFGLVSRSPALGADEFVLLRYTIVHCVADAVPVGLLVVHLNGVSWTVDQWVEVDGVLASRAVNGGEHLVSIDAERVSAVAEPPSPYLQAL